MSENNNQKPPPSNPNINNNNNNNETEKNKSPSLANRIQNSATGLARDAFFSAPGSSSSDLRNVLANGEKGGGTTAGGVSTLGQTQSIGGGQHTYTSASGSGSMPAAGISTGAESFREPTIQDENTGTGMEFDIFDGPPPRYREIGENLQRQQQLFEALLNRNTINRNTPSTIDAWEHGETKGKEKQQEEDNYLPTFNSAWDSAASRYQNQTTTPTIPEPTTSETTTYSNNDGLAVTSLLTTPTFDPEFINDPDYEDVNTTNAIQNAQLPTREEYEKIDTFKKTLPPPSHNVGIRHTSLIPDIGSFLDSIPPPSTSSQSTDLRDEVLSSLPGSEDWFSVEERYHDEVWGFLKPSLEAAKKELEEQHKNNDVQQGPAHTDGPAVRRLKMVLSHMQG